MPINLKPEGDHQQIVIEGVVVPEDVDLLYELIRDHPAAQVDMSACEHLHTAALQLLLLSGATIAAQPADPFWQHFF